MSSDRSKNCDGVPGNGRRTDQSVQRADLKIWLAATQRVVRESKRTVMVPGRHVPRLLLQQIIFQMICKARYAVDHTNSLVRIISCNLGRQLVQNSLLDLVGLEFNQSVLSLAIHRQARTMHAHEL